MKITEDKLLKSDLSDDIDVAENHESEEWGTFLDKDQPVSQSIWGHVHFIRNAGIKRENLYLDEEQKTIRYTYKDKGEGNIRNETIITLKPDENRLSEIITQLPYGLIDKQATGIGATHLELISERNSIIVVPTRALGESKCAKAPNKVLYIGTKNTTNKVTSNREIRNYLNNPGTKYIKIVVVADSLGRIIKIIEEKRNVYQICFLMVDEIDTIQSDNHYRPQLSNVIDYYCKFRLQRRALVSATVKEFSHPKLREEPLTTIKRLEPLKRNINLFYTNNINQLLSDEIRRIAKEHPTEKILIAYNSIQNILETINLLLPDISKENFGILCSEINADEAGIYKTSIKDDSLARRITFMTCAFFVGIDIEDRCHLITISSVLKGYTMLSLNRMTQIHGRCRNGILSDTIIYNCTKKPFKYIENYKGKLEYKAQKVLDLLKAADKLKKNDGDLEDLFERIEKVIIERADENLNGMSVRLTRKNIDGNREISHFNVDALFEQMETYSTIYSDKESLLNGLQKDKHNVEFKEILFEIEEKQENIEKESKSTTIQNKVQSCIRDILEMKENNALNDDSLNAKIRQAMRYEQSFYRRVKELYKYIDIDILTEKLSDISTKDIRPYRSFKNAVYFWALEEDHPLKVLVKDRFKIGERYSNNEIEVAMSEILQNQIFKSLYDKNTEKYSRSRLVNFFKSILDWSYPAGKYLVKGYTPKQLRGLEEPLERISRKAYATNYFEV